MPGEVLKKLREACGWTHEEMAAAMGHPNRGLGRHITAERVAELENQDLKHPVALCVQDIATEEKLVWQGGRWVPAKPERMTGKQIRELRTRLRWTQGRLARELGTSQPVVARWEANEGRAVSALVTVALRATVNQRSVQR